MGAKKYNEYEVRGDVVYIKLSNCDEYAIVNLDKWNTISYIREFYWYKDNGGYACTEIPKKLRDVFQRRRIRLHRLILNCEDGYIVDHFDRNKLNNLTENLRQATYQDNARNISIPKDNTSGVIGVSWHKTTNQWRAYIVVNKKQIHLGNFTNKNDAIQARRDAEGKYFGNHHKEVV